MMETRKFKFAFALLSSHQNLLHWEIEIEMRWKFYKGIFNRGVFFVAPAPTKKAGSEKKPAPDSGSKPMTFNEQIF